MMGYSDIALEETTVVIDKHGFTSMSRLLSDLGHTWEYQKCLTGF